MQTENDIVFETNNDIKVYLEEDEVLFLAAVTGNYEFIGIESPVYGMSVDEIRKKWEQIKSNLKSKKYIKIGKQGNIILDSTLYAVIDTCCCSDNYLLFNCSDKISNSEFESHYYVSRYFIVEMKNYSKEKLKYQFEIIEETEKFKESIFGNVNLDEINREFLETIKIPQMVLEEINMKIKNEQYEKACKILKESGCNEVCIGRVIEVLKKTRKYISLVLMDFTKKHKENPNKVIVIQNNDIFLIENDYTQGMFSFIPVSYKEAFKAISDILECINNVCEFE